MNADWSLEENVQHKEANDDFTDEGNRQPFPTRWDREANGQMGGSPRAYDDSTPDDGPTDPISDS